MEIIKMKKTAFAGWKNCIEIPSGKSKLIVTTDVGPRIIGGFIGKSKNIFHVKPETTGKSGGETWNIYGGHRLWHSPEAMPRSYAPDNTKVEFKQTKDGFYFSSGTEEITRIHKSMTIVPLGKNRYEICHKLRNDNLWDVEVAAWALSVMEPGGVSVVPMPEGDKKGLLPNRYLTVWPYTNMADNRFVWGEKYVMLKQDEKAKTPCKYGLNCEDGWIAYVNNGVAFIKSFDHIVDAEYPDNGCSIEIYSCPWMLEVETLSPLYLLGPGEELTHVEYFQLVDGMPEIKSEKDAAKAFKNL